jgi:glycyl-tRNA synthetase
LRERPELSTVTIDRGLAVAAERLREHGVVVSDDAVGAAREFIIARFAQQLRDDAVPADFVDAVLPGANAPGRAAEELAVLRNRADDAKFRELVTALQRIARIVPPSTSSTNEYWFS